MGLYHCPFCSSKQTLVRETYSGAPMVRYRRCPKCKKRFKTVEVTLVKHSEEYLDMVSKMSAEQLRDRVVKVLTSRATQNVILEQLKKAAGIKKGKVTSPADVFT